MLRLLTVWLIAAAALWVTAAVLPGTELHGTGSALAAALAVGALNGLLWPLMVRFALPITVLTLGLGALVLNGLVLWGASEILPGFEIASIADGVAATLVLAAMTSAINALLAIDDDDSFQRRVVARRARRSGKQVSSEVPGIVFLEIDGLAHDVLRRAVQDGNAPTMARWLREGTHRLVGWETDWSSQTGASQTGLLQGSNENIPAFRWWDKSRGRAVSSSSVKDVEAIEKELSNGRGLLFANGASRSNMYSGDAPHSLLTVSTVRNPRRGRLGEDYYAYFASPYGLARTLSLVVADVVSELFSARQQRRRDVLPRVHRDFKYSLIRAAMTVVQRDLLVSAVVGDICHGRPVVYATFSGYDEVAHHSGIERSDALAVLREIDRQLGRLERALADAPRPYHLVVLSDHGQSQGETFLQRYGVSLEEVVEELTSAEDVEAEEMGSEAVLQLGVGAAEAAQGKGAVGMAARVVTRKAEEDPGDEPHDLPELSVMASGNLGLISFPREDGRLSLERIDQLYPRLLGELRAHPGIGFMLVRSDEHGAVVSGRPAPTISRTGASRAATHLPPTVRTRPRRSGAPTASRTARTSS